MSENTKKVLIGVVLLVVGVVVGVTWASAQRELGDQAPGWADASVSVGKALTQMPANAAAKALAGLPEELAIASFIEMAMLDEVKAAKALAELIKENDNIRAARLLIEAMEALRLEGNGDRMEALKAAVIQETYVLDAAKLSGLLQEMNRYAAERDYSNLLTIAEEIRGGINTLRAAAGMFPIPEEFAD